VFKRYGREQVSLVGNYTTYKNDSIIRELGKVFGLPDAEIKELQRTNSPRDNNQRLIMQYGKRMKDFPSNCSVHACGLFISEEPITHHTALFLPPKGMATAQIDMYVAEDIGLNKYDILSQRGLSHIREALQLIKRNKGVDIDIHDTNKFKKDPKVNAQIKNADTIGCFYIESPAMRHLLMKLKCDDYITLVAASSIIRPGVAESGMMREYIYRYHNREGIKYLHPIFEEHLAETFGVMVFQEDVIKIAHYFAGLSLGDADVLRRAMNSSKYKGSSFETIRNKYFAACKERGHSGELAAEVWRQMESFAGYSFCKAHSASFAVESYMSLYLKTYYPKEFMVAVINNFGGFYSTELYFMELFKAGGKLEAPCVNHSDEYTTIEEEQVYVGLIHIKGLRKELLYKIVEERQLGIYVHLQDFMERVQPGITQLELLISVGAFRFTGKSKKQLLWEANHLHHRLQVVHANRLFNEPLRPFQLPDLTDHPLDDCYDQIEHLGFPLCNPFELVEEDPALYIAAKELTKHANKVVTVLVYFITHKQVPTKQGETMYFGTFLDSKLDWVDTVHFPESAKKYPLDRAGFFKATGKVTLDFGVVSLEVSKMSVVPYRIRQYADR
jgi:DNA polymerase III alpha subunit